MVGVGAVAVLRGNVLGKYLLLTYFSAAVVLASSLAFSRGFQVMMLFQILLGCFFVYVLYQWKPVATNENIHGELGAAQDRPSGGL